MDYNGLNWIVMDYNGLYWTIMDFYNASFIGSSGFVKMQRHEQEIKLLKKIEKWSGNF